MARTRAQIEEILTKRLIKQHTDSFTFNDLMAVMSNATAQQKDRFIDAIKLGNSRVVMNMMQMAMNASASSKAATEVQQILADDTLDLAELDRVL